MFLPWQPPTPRAPPAADLEHDASAPRCSLADPYPGVEQARSTPDRPGHCLRLVLETLSIIGDGEGKPTVSELQLDAHLGSVRVA